MSLRLMKERVQQGGASLREEQIRDAQDILAYSFDDDISYNPNMVFYKTETSLPIKMHNQKSSSSYGIVTSFLTTHDNPLELGQMLYDTKKDEYWLCVESYDVAGVHYEGKLGRCMRWLKWQDNNGVIQEIPTIVTSASKYNNGEKSDEVLSIGSDQLLVFVQLNEDTCKLDRGKKFFIDEKKDNPTTYELTRADTALYTYMGKGILSMILTECAYTASEDDLKHGICDYISPTSPPEDNDKTVVLSGAITGNISGNKNLKVGFERTYAADLVDEDGNALEWSDDFSWNIPDNVEVISTTNGGEVELLVEDEDLIDTSFVLQILDNKNGSVITEITITVVGMF